MSTPPKTRRYRFSTTCRMTEHVEVTPVSDETHEAHPASWYIQQGIKDLGKVPQVFRDIVDEHITETDGRFEDVTARLKAVDAKYDEILQALKDLGDRVAKATEALKNRD